MREDEQRPVPRSAVDSGPLAGACREGRSVEHATFVVERRYDAAPERAFAARADADAKAQWICVEKDRGRPVAIASRYSDDEPGSPWTWILYIDARAADEQRSALEEIFAGRLGGDTERHFPWAWKPSTLVAVRPVEIEVDHTRRRQRLRVRDHVSVRIRDRYDGENNVTCVIPGP